MNSSTVDLPITDLCRRCRDQAERFRRGEPYEDSFCFEVFRRAVVERDDRCWAELHAIYEGQVQIWCRTAGAARLETDELAALGWQRFWRYYTPEKLTSAGGSAAALRYLKMCIRSVAVDEARREAGAVQRTRPLPDDLPGAESETDAVVERSGRADFWQAVEASVKSTREREILYLAFDLGLSSAEIRARRPDLFPDVRDVYRTTRNLLDRLRRSPELRAWRATEGSS